MRYNDLFPIEDSDGSKATVNELATYLHLLTGHDCEDVCERALRGINPEIMIRDGRPIIAIDDLPAVLDRMSGLILIELFFPYYVTPKGMVEGEGPEDDGQYYEGHREAPLPRLY